MSFTRRWGSQLQELRQLGARGVAFRLGWEARVRTGLIALGELRGSAEPPDTRWFERGPFRDLDAPRRTLQDRVSEEARAALVQTALDACDGRIRAFGHLTLDFGATLDSHRDPTTGTRWNQQAHWSRALREPPQGADVKIPWELGRFPHAYHMARASLVTPSHSARFKGALARQIHAFVTQNPFGNGVHWASGQEIALRMLAWAFAAQTLFAGDDDVETRSIIARAILAGARHVAHHIEFARRAVHNNHILSEAFGLYMAARLFPETPEAGRWRRLGLDLLGEQVPRQFYRDGGYIQLSHTYHRLALQVLLAAVTFARATDDRVPREWTDALERSLDFLSAQQNPEDGRLPNFGPNDGALPLILSTSDYPDFRPVLQVVSVLTRGERLYAPGPWDEELAWWLGAKGLDAPTVSPLRASVSFSHTGLHVIRGRSPSNFGVLRCGTVPDRFGQIDMLHLDLWWRGENVLVDAGSYRYNGAPDWHNHFVRTESHNTVRVDDRDQMLHFRQFKFLYPTEAAMLRFWDCEDWALCEGEHYGYLRDAVGVTHRRGVLFAKDLGWVVTDHLLGDGTHTLELHWLCSTPGLSTVTPTETTDLALATRTENLVLRVFSLDGRAMKQEVVSGRDAPPRGWLSRYYFGKEATPSSLTRARAACPFVFVSVLSPKGSTVTPSAQYWTLRVGESSVRFRPSAERLECPSVERGRP